MYSRLGPMQWIEQYKCKSFLLPRYGNGITGLDTSMIRESLNCIIASITKGVLFHKTLEINVSIIAYSDSIDMPLCAMSRLRL